MDVRQFRFERIINDNSENLSVATLARHIDEDKQAIIIFAKKQFTTEQTTQLISDDLTKILRTTQSNDKFSQYDAIVDPLKNDLMISMIYPVTEREIAKYSSQKHYLIRESPADFKSITEPYIQSISPEHKQWLVNIVEHKSETERILFEDLSNRDTGFILVPDFKWDQARIEYLYTLVIALRDDIRCVRDLTGSHIEMLENMKEKTLTAIHKRWNIPSHFIRLFVHYLPSYYHFHIHACHVNCPTFGNGLVIGKAIMLDDIIDNLKTNSNYYQQTNLSFTVKELDPLFKLLVENGKIQ